MTTDLTELVFRYWLATTCAVNMVTAPFIFFVVTCVGFRESWQDGVKQALSFSVSVTLFITLVFLAFYMFFAIVGVRQ